MTKQDKVNRLEKSGKKVSFLMNGQGLIVAGKKFESVNSAHKYFYGY